MTTKSSNKRTRLNSVTSNQKKKKEIIYDDDIEEIFPEKKLIEKTGTNCSFQKPKK